MLTKNLQTGYSNSEECRLWCKLANLATQLKGTEVAVFVNDKYNRTRKMRF